MQRALDSRTGLPSRRTSAAWMLALRTPADVRRSFMVVPLLRGSSSGDGELGEGHPGHGVSWWFEGGVVRVLTPEAVNRGMQSQAANQANPQ